MKGQSQKPEVKVMHRNPEDYKNNTMRSNFMHVRNFDKNIHLFQREIEYKRALNATKMDKIFAKPLVKCLDGHDDSIRSICVSNKNLTDLYSGSCNGFINIWNIFDEKLMRKLKAHEGFVRGLCISYDEKYLFSCGDDKYIKQWVIDKNKNINELNEDDTTQQNLHNFDYLENEIVPKKIYVCKSVPNSIDKHFSEPLIISGSQTLDVWDYYRNNAIASFDYNSEYIYYVKFNYSQRNLVGLTLSDNSIGLVDIKSKTPIQKLFLKYRSNSLSWNNMNPKQFIVANEDSNLYTFDIRYLKTAYLVHKGFVNAVLDVDYSPIGNKFVACSYDKTIRLFNSDEPQSYDVYHTKRMQHVLCCKYTLDSKYILSGSSDMCIRIWKSCSHEPSGVLSNKEKQAINYRNKLKEKYSSLKEIKRIRQHHHVPALIKSMSDKKKIMLDAKKRKEKNRIQHSKNKDQLPIPEKKKIFVTEQ
ncbi:protein SOF1, putative [Plasmodium chabaudi chabaudi]|uniref:DDB1- and CUL4-associated factor 13 n=1 Tax=Plasmodium chabaudi chabaudi TaxID=31271 RepID=A0A077YEF7_PLACU|nr:protein SOF1, putative [Plasmodium chabaudi chabaudi]SCM01894.1 protein SOF1, putative [Plasmodium chabaudi chabaudi]SCM03778.1 protein SOF1, putative [Plasmodium chabaudi chabaudi]VTZ66413.1 protein SOF1, putative [Plasmodium chabaudi chabaudi]|eukprot:XP_738549.2 40S ribosomal processing protein, putative [Plasmodium chabaudi chabaudi]